MEKGLFEYLRDNVTIKAIISQRVTQDLLPQKPTYPALTFYRISTERNRAMGGSSVQKPRFQIDCWDTSRNGAMALADAVRGQLDWESGALGTSTILHAECIDERNDYDADAKVFRTSLDFYIWQAE